MKGLCSVRVATRDIPDPLTGDLDGAEIHEAYPFHYYRIGEKKDPRSFLARSYPLFPPKPVPLFTPARRGFRLDGIVT